MTYAQATLLERDRPAPPRLTLRAHQERVFDELRGTMAEGHRRIMLCAPTGYGKTEVACAIMSLTRAKGKRVAFVAGCKELVWQAAKRLQGYGIPHGMTQAENQYGRSEKIQVLSAQTLERRGSYPEGLDLVIIDEAHEIRVKLMAWLAAMGVRYIGLSATPITPNLGRYYDTVINASTTAELLEGKLVGPLEDVRREAHEATQRLP